MIQALKPDPNPSTAGQAPSKEPRTPDPTFDPMLASLVAQMLGSLPQALPQGAAPQAPRPEPASPRAEAPASRPAEARNASRPAEKMERRTARREDAAASEAKAPQERVERPEAARSEATVAAEPAAEPVAEAPVQPKVPVAQALGAQGGAALAAQAVLEAEAAPDPGLDAVVPTSEAPVSEAAAPRLRHAVADSRVPVALDRPAETKAPVIVEPLAPKTVAPEAVVQGLPTVGDEAPTAPAAADPGATPKAAAPEAPKAAPILSAAPGEVAPTISGSVESAPSVRPAVVPAGTKAAPEAKAPETPSAKPQASVSPITPVAAAAVAAVASARESGLAQGQAQGQAAKAEPRIQAVHAPGSATAPQRVQPFTAPAAPTKAAPHPALTQVDGTIRWILRKQEQGADLQLHPESLGKVQIKLTVEGQQVHAQVWASEPATLPILRENLAFLEVSLREQGLSLGNFQLHQGDRGQDAGFAQQPNPTPGWVGGVGATESLQEVPLSVPTPVLGAYRIEVFA